MKIQDGKYEHNHGIFVHSEALQNVLKKVPEITDAGDVVNSVAFDETSRKIQVGAKNDDGTDASKSITVPAVKMNETDLVSVDLRTADADPNSLNSLHIVSEANPSDSMDISFYYVMQKLIAAHPDLVPVPDIGYMVFDSATGDDYNPIQLIFNIYLPSANITEQSTDDFKVVLGGSATSTINILNQNDEDNPFYQLFVNTDMTSINHQGQVVVLYKGAMVAYVSNTRIVQSLINQKMDWPKAPTSAE